MAFVEVSGRLLRGSVHIESQLCLIVKLVTLASLLFVPLKSSQCPEMASVLKLVVMKLSNVSINFRAKSPYK